MVKYVVRLTEEERTALTEVIGKGKAAARKIKHANVLLKLDAGGPGWSDPQAADAFDCSARTVFGIRQRCVETDLEAAPECQKREHPPPVNGFLAGTARHNWCASPAPHRAARRTGTLNPRAVGRQPRRVEGRGGHLAANRHAHA
jgi:hypothetical protein